MVEVYKVDPERPRIDAIARAAEVIRRGGLVAFPTETVYGLGADAFNKEAVKKIFKAKGRPLDNPIIVHIAEKEKIHELAREIPEEAEKLMEKFFPGPLTLVLKKNPKVPDEVTAGLDSVAVRMPRNMVALELIREAETPIAAPSANKSGRLSPTRAEHVLEDLGDVVDVVLDGGETTYGLESTVLDLTTKPPQILRPGAITLEELRETLGEVRLHPAVSGIVDEKTIEAKSPGMKYRHYAPRAELFIVVGSREKITEKITELVREFKRRGDKVGVAAITPSYYPADHIEELGQTKQEIAKNLFDKLRKLDKTGVNIIIAEGVDEEGLGLAIMNRLKKAAGYRIIKTN